ncbi:MAG: hypothetical protein GWN87_19260, partial [Desulfuromonadales bacterium]|nr:hypothetical protein [Desulfuromonadales bacterium]NIS42185.1 hypothetical protein [Desulfuromonadales bacterium]
MKKSFELTDTKLSGRSQKVIRNGFIGAALILAATLLGATVAAEFDATYIKVSLAIMTIPAYAYYFLSGF